jgi:hypothetical protein
MLRINESAKTSAKPLLKQGSELLTKNKLQLRRFAERRRDSQNKKRNNQRCRRVSGKIHFRVAKTQYAALAAHILCLR